MTQSCQGVVCLTAGGAHLSLLLSTRCQNTAVVPCRPSPEGPAAGGTSPRTGTASGEVDLAESRYLGSLCRDFMLPAGDSPQGGAETLVSALHLARAGGPLAPPASRRKCRFRKVWRAERFTGELLKGERKGRVCTKPAPALSHGHRPPQGAEHSLPYPRAGTEPALAYPAAGRKGENSHEALPASSSAFRIS